MQSKAPQKVEYIKAKKNCEYYIVAEKEGFSVDENSLAFNYDETERTIEIINNQLFSGNFDYVLVEENRIENTYSHIPCMENEINKI